MPRCKKGTRRNKTTGNCTKEGNHAQKRCPNGTRKSGILGKPCVTTDEIMIQKFNDMHKQMKSIAYAIEEIFYNLHEGMTPKILKKTKSKIASGLERIENICVKYARTRISYISAPKPRNVHHEIHATKMNKQMVDALDKGHYGDADKIKSEYVGDIYAYVKHNERILAESQFEAHPDWVSFT